jgi:hypothetical protein
MFELIWKISLIKRGYSEPYIDDIMPKEDYFRKLVKQNFTNLKFPKETRMGKCQKCVSLRLKIANVYQNQEDADQFHETLRDHLEWQRREREALNNRIEFAEVWQKKVLMISSDCPSSVSLPSFNLQNRTKEAQKKALDFRWTGTD